jgi:predicted metal-dependent phosphoesterase TrpH
MPLKTHPLRYILESVTVDSCPKRINFHCHTLCSDGSFTPEALADQAVEIGLEHLAVTDHHSLEAFPDVQKRLAFHQAAGKQIPTLWTGTEVSCVLENCLVHVLALGYQQNHLEMAPYLQGDTVVGDQLTAEAVVKAIHGADGLALLAHPARYRINFKLLLRAAAKLGFDGAETWYDYEMQPRWRPSPHICERVGALATDLNLLHSCGTDSHGLSLLGR